MAHLYFIQAGNPEGPIKIGIAKDVRKRVEMLQTGSHERLTTLASFWCGDSAYPLEQSFHRMFTDLRIGKSEWFTFHKDLVDTFTLLKRVEENFRSMPKGVRVIFEFSRDAAGIRIRPRRTEEKKQARPFEPTLAVFIDAQTVADLPEGVRAALGEIAGICTRLVERSEGFVVCDARSRELWRGVWDREIETKHCIECGNELTGEIQRTTWMGDRSTATNGEVRIHFCEKHPS